MSEPGESEPSPSGPGPSQPLSMRPEEERTWGALAHVAAFTAFIGLPVVGPLVIFFVFGPRSQFVRHHSAEAINFNITVAIALIVSAVLILVVIGLLLLIVVGIAWFILTIVAAAAASRGEWYRYPMTIRFVR